jgi:hypothetical protein
MILNRFLCTQINKFLNSLTFISIIIDKRTIENPTILEFIQITIILTLLSMQLKMIEIIICILICHLKDTLVEEIET